MVGQSTLRWVDIPECNICLPPIDWNPSKNTSKQFKGKLENNLKKENTNICSYKVPLNKAKPEEELVEKVVVVDNRSMTPEEYCKWRGKIDQLFKSMNGVTPEKRFSVFQSQMEGKMLEVFMKAHEEHARKRQHHLNEDKLQSIAYALNEVALLVFPEREGSARLQKLHANLLADDLPEAQGLAGKIR